MTHALAFLAGVVVTIVLVWGWVGAQLGSVGDELADGDEA